MLISCGHVHNTLVMENNDCTRLSSESLSGDEVDLQDKDKEITEDLKLGAEFSSHESAYIAYVKYGGTHGFNVRKQHRKTNKKVIEEMINGVKVHLILYQFQGLVVKHI
ncbi:protein FAR1-RELATED SEQUENCE 5-like isoform X1 [Prunus yedoensis var. nudiflora]|uniref:Protein FAR1-RELATED SEQUENCE 5-like isoform X1 n=1 Tax=Prunus yedoensis var. nudiflora TaxID=2094558 RepID=A0A314ZKW0_PRUYE|nr:protein FAR1-RELATED SEQUENCE 5-like isoform X1 [Prunus yedoensis var. nudiflora]